MASDGLWNVCTHKEAAKFVHQLIEKGISPEGAAQALVQNALDKGTRDNVTVLIVVINWSPVLP